MTQLCCAADWKHMEGSHMVVCNVVQCDDTSYRHDRIP